MIAKLQNCKTVNPFFNLLGLR